MKLLRNLAVAAITAVTTMSPAMARVDKGTSNLINTLSQNGIHVTINEQCDGGYHGQYRWLGMKREMHLCPGNTIDANDHNTVRHEAIHAIQHCVNAARGTHTDTPVMKYEKLRDLVNTHLSVERVNWIKSSYTEDQWLTEFEAFVMAKIATADEISKIFMEACVGG